jgi:hypothetical protein
MGEAKRLTGLLCEPGKADCCCMGWGLLGNEGRGGLVEEGVGVGKEGRVIGVF